MKKQTQKLKKIGITGAIASGKSTLLRWLKSKGFPVFSADEIIREKVYVDNSVINSLQQLNNSYVNGNVVDKIQLLEGLKSVKHRQEIEAITHARVQECLLDFFQEAERVGSSACFAEIPLLYEADFDALFDAVVVTEKPEKVRLDDMRDHRKWAQWQITLLESLHYSPAKKARSADLRINMMQQPDEVLESLFKHLGG